LDLLVEKRTRDGNPLLLFGPMAVTTELPVMTPAEVREKVRRAILTCQGKADLVLFTSNTINPDVPLENVRAMYEEVRNA
jgi:uroporphyrinogen-III decarboxylase